MSKRKTHTSLKRRELIARAISKDLAIAMVLGSTKYCTVVNLKTGREVKMTRQRADLIVNTPWQWNIECSVICRDQTGKEYVSSEAIQCQSRYRQSDPRLNEFLNTHHRKFLAEQNPMHVITLAWVAVPNLSTEIPMPMLEKIYRDLGAFEHLSKWESDQQEQVA